MTRAPRSGTPSGRCTRPGLTNLETTDPSTTLKIPPHALPSADGENLRLRWAIVAAGVRDGLERVVVKDLRVEL